MDRQEGLFLVWVAEKTFLAILLFITGKPSH